MPGAVEQETETLMGGHVARIQLQRLLVIPDGAVDVSLALAIVGGAGKRVIIHKLLADSGDGVGPQVDEFGNVGGPVGRGQMRQDNRGRALALLVDVRQEQLGVG